MISFPPLRLLEDSLPTLAENLATDEALLTVVDQEMDSSAQGILRLWEWPDFAVILGRSSRIRQEVHLANCEAQGVPILRRCSGGGVVVLGPGCLLYSLFLPMGSESHLRDIRQTTQEIMQRMASAIRPVVPEIEVDGISDLVINGRKVSGNAQRWGRRTVLHHGTLLYDFPLEVIPEFLAMPLRQPDYRANRSHGEFVTNLPLNKEQLRNCLVSEFNARPSSLPIAPGQIHKLVAERYSQREWTWKL